MSVTIFGDLHQRLSTNKVIKDVIKCLLRNLMFKSLSSQIAGMRHGRRNDDDNNINDECDFGKFRVLIAFLQAL